MTDFVSASKYAAAPDRVGEPDTHPVRPSGEFICNVLSNDWVNGEYKLLVLEAPPRALKPQLRLGGRPEGLPCRLTVFFFLLLLGD